MYRSYLKYVFERKLVMANKEILVTAEGLRELEEELSILKSQKRADIAEQIKEARSHGDLSENSEYDEAMNDQAQLEARISEIEATLKHVRVIDQSEITTDTVQVGTKVKVLDVEYDEEEEYQIVGSTEADPLKGLISDESPVGKGLLNHAVGETVEIETPGGIQKYKILDISK